jgi:hypothetical protein
VTSIRWRNRCLLSTITWHCWKCYSNYVCCGGGGCCWCEFQICCCLLSDCLDDLKCVNAVQDLADCNSAHLGVSCDGLNRVVRLYDVLFDCWPKHTYLHIRRQTTLTRYIVTCSNMASHYGHVPRAIERLSHLQSIRFTDMKQNTTLPALWRLTTLREARLLGASLIGTVPSLPASLRHLYVFIHPPLVVAN